MAMSGIKLKTGESLFSEKRKATFRKEQYEYVHTGIIDADGETWTTTELDEANINQVWNQYRERHGIPFPDEIRRLREYYGLSAAKMAVILGFGVNQYRHYESGEVPNESNARIIMAIRDKATFLEFLDASRDTLSERDLTKIRNRIEGLANYPKPTTPPDVFSGYVSYDAAKVRHIVLYLIERMGGVFVTKMNKLLFYCDFLSFRRTGFGMTGLRYKAMQYGPVPENWGNVYDSLGGVEMNETITSSQSTGIRLESKETSDTSSLTEEGRQVLEDICSRFSAMTARDISLASHKEKGWIECNSAKALINYSYAFSLTLN